MARFITSLRLGQIVNYNNRKCMVVDIYPAIAYLKDTETDKVFCVCLGDLVIAGIEPSMQIVIPGVKKNPRGPGGVLA